MRLKSSTSPALPLAYQSTGCPDRGSKKTGLSSVTRSGLFVRLKDTGADGFVPISTLGDEYFIYDEGQHVLVGERSGAGYRLGDNVDVRLIEAVPTAGALRFEMLTDPQRLPAMKATRSRPRFRSGPPRSRRR